MSRTDKKKEYRSTSSEKAAYNHRKAEVFEREKTNDRLVILFRSDGNWWKIIGRSVFYYSKLVAPRLDIKPPRILVDTDYDSVSEQGTITIRDIETLLEKVRGLGLKIEKPHDANYRAIHLNNKVTAEEYQAMVKEEEARFEAAEHIILPAVIWPGIKQQTFMLLERTRSITRWFRTDTQRSIGDHMVELGVDLVTTLGIAAHDRMDQMEALVRMRDDLDAFDGYIMAIMGMRIAPGEAVYDLSTKSVETRKRVDREIAKVAKREAKLKREMESLKKSSPKNKSESAEKLPLESALESMSENVQEI